MVRRLDEQPRRTRRSQPPSRVRAGQLAARLETIPDAEGPVPPARSSDASLPGENPERTNTLVTIGRRAVGPIPSRKTRVTAVESDRTRANASMSRHASRGGSITGQHFLE